MFEIIYFLKFSFTQRRQEGNTHTNFEARFFAISSLPLRGLGIGNGDIYIKCT